MNFLTNPGNLFGTKVALKTAVEIYKTTDKFQEEKNAIETNKDPKLFDEYIINNTVYNRKELEEAATKYNMDYASYVKKMQSKGLKPFTRSTDTDEDIDIKADTIIQKIDDEMYNENLSQEEYDKHQNWFSTKNTMNDDGEVVDAVYETEDGNYRRSRGTLNTDQLSRQAKKVFNQLVSSDEYINNYPQNWLKDNQQFLNEQTALLREKYDVTTTAGLTKANKELNDILSEVIANSSQEDEQYNSTIKKYTDVINNKYGGKIRGRAILEAREDLIQKDDWAGPLYDIMPDFATGLLTTAYQVDKSWNDYWYGDYREDIRRIKQDIADIEENGWSDTYKSDTSDKYIIGLDRKHNESLSDYETRNAINQGGYGFKDYSVSDSTKEEALANARAEIKELEKKSIAEAMDSKDVQESLLLLGSPEFFNEDMEFEFDVDTYQRVLGTQGGQMVLAALTAGGSTYFQEAGGNLAGQTAYHAAQLAFPELDEEKAAQKFFELSEEQQIEYMNEAYDAGLINFDDAVKNGVLNAGLDMVSNFVTIAKATKAVKFMPKTFLRLATQEGWRKTLKYAGPGVMKTLFYDIFPATATEVITELSQEAISEYYVNKNTAGKPFADVIASDQFNRLMWETGVQTAMVPGTLTTVSKVSQTGYKFLDNAITNYMEMNDPSSLNSYVKKRMDIIDSNLKKGLITPESAEQMKRELEQAEGVLRNSKNKYLSGANKESVLEQEILKVEAENKLNKLKEDNKNHFKERQGKKQGRKSKLELEAQSLQKIIDDADLSILKTRLKAGKKSNRRLATFVNSQKEGIFKDSKVRVFKTIKAAVKWVDGRKVYLAKAIKTAKGDRLIKLQKELKELNNEDLKDVFGGKKNNGANLGDTAIVVEENVDNNIENKNDLYAANTFHHEVLHFMVNKMFKGANGLKELKILEKQIRPLLGNNLSKLVDNKIKAYKSFYNQLVLDGKMKKEKADEMIANEFLTSLSDSLRIIDEGNWEQDGLLQRAFDGIANVLSKVIKQKAPNLNFDISQMTGADALQFLKKYNDFNGTKKIKFNVPIFKAKAVTEVEEEITDARFSLSIEDSEEVNKIYKEQGLAGTMDILDILKPTAKGIANRYDERPSYPGSRLKLKQDPNAKRILIDEIQTGERGMLDVIMTYDKKVQEGQKVGPLSGFLNTSFSTKTGFKRYIEIANRVLGEGDQSIFASDVTEAKGVVAQESQGLVVDVKSSTLKEGLSLDEDIINKIKNSVVKTFGTRLPQVGSKDFKKALQDAYRTELFKVMKNLMGTRTAFKMFISKNGRLIYKAIPQQTINKRFNQFAVPVLDKDGKQLREKTPQGNAVFNKKPFDQAEFENYFLGSNIGGSTKGTRKDALAEALAQELAFDATMEVIQREDVAKKFNTVNEIQGFVLPENYLAILDKDIDRDRNALFSITVSTMPVDLSNVFVANRKDFFTNINELGITKTGIGAALDKSFGKGFFGTYRKGIVDDFYKNLQNYKKAQENYEKSNRTFKPTIEDYVTTLDNQLDNYLSVSSFFGLKEGMAGIFRNKENVQHQRQYIGGEFAQYLKSKYGSIKAIQMLLTAKGAFEDGTTRGKRAMIYDNKADFVNMLNLIDPDFTVVDIRGGVTINGQEFKPTKANEKVTKSHLDGTENIELGEIKAKEAQVFLKDLFGFMGSNPEGYTKVNQAMVVAGLLGNMKTPLRAAAAYRYISDILPNKNPKDYRYEHLIPARVVAFYMAESYLNGNKSIDINTLLNDYSVAIIPKTMDKIIGKLFGSTMNPDYKIGMHPSKRYYNMFTKGEVQFAIKDLRNGKVYGQGYADIYPVIQSAKKDNANLSIVVNEDQSIQEQMQTFKNMEAALNIAKNPNAPVKGISVFDFDDTLARSNSKVGVTMPDGTFRKINATEFAIESADLEAAGAVFDFTEFNKVIDGKKGPLFDLATRRQDKFTSKDIFILTARPQEAAYAIHAFLKGIGLNIPVNNIVGLADGKPEAKADWILGKAAKGYNNFYFADDAYKNVAVVQKVLKVIDVKNKVELAKFSISLETEMNQIIEDESGVASWKTFSKAAAKQMGATRRSKWRFFVPPSAEDFTGLLYDLLAKGAKGDRQMEFFEKHLLKPYNKAYRDLNNAKETISNDYRVLKKTFKDVKKKLGKPTNYKNFTYDQAIRVYLWDKNGITIPGLSKTDQKKLVAIVKKDQRLIEFADILSNITKLKEGYVKPEQDWLGGSIAKDLNDVVDRIGRKRFLKDWIENKNEIFSDDVMNKLEAIYGTAYSDALKDILYRMEFGTNRQAGTSKVVNTFMNWVNNSVGAIMFFNMRSALLQTISSINFINWSDNNILKAGLAFANQPQYWSDFAMIFNSPTLRQRRKGLQKDVNEAELANTAANSKNKAQAALAYLLKIGFTPTQLADSFAIASGGATFYRNRLNTYIKQGLSQKDAETRAFDDFLEASEKAQQSSRPDLISPIQAGPLGRLIFAFQNTPMQYTRIIKKAMRDIGNNRGDFKTNLSKILYYGAMQNILFTGLQNAMFGQLFEDDEDEEVEEKYRNKKRRMLNNMVDTFLRGSGLTGAIVSTAKNTIMKFFEQEKKGWTADHTYTMIELTNLSPPVGSKLRKIYSGIQTYKFNKKIIKPMGFDIDNPVWGGIGSVVSGVTNFPLDRMLHLIDSAREATDQNNAAWQRIALLLGWRTWDVGATNEEVDAFKNKDKKPSRSKGSRKKKTRPKN